MLDMVEQTYLVRLAPDGNGNQCKCNGRYDRAAHYEQANVEGIVPQLLVVEAEL